MQNPRHYAISTGRRLLCAVRLRIGFGSATEERCVHRAAIHYSRNKKHETNVSALFKPVQVQANIDDEDVGSELVGKLEKSELLKILNKFAQRREIKALCSENGLDCKLFPVASNFLILSNAPAFSLPTATGLWLFSSFLH